MRAAQASTPPASACSRPNPALRRAWSAWRLRVPSWQGGCRCPPSRARACGKAARSAESQGARDLDDVFLVRLAHIEQLEGLAATAPGVVLVTVRVGPPVASGSASSPRMPQNCS